MKDPDSNCLLNNVIVSSTKTRTKYRTLFLIQIQEHFKNIQNIKKLVFTIVFCTNNCIKKNVLDTVLFLVDETKI